MPENPLPLLLLPGMAADARLFASQLSAFPSLVVPPWLAPLPREPLRSYARRLAAAIDPGVPCVVGGASFGGLVALAVAAHLDARACVLIGSVRSPAELPLRWRAVRPLAALGPDGLGVAAGVLARAGGLWLSRGTVRGLRRLAAPEGAFLRWATWAVLGWRPRPAVRRARVFQIHGERDRVLPVGRTRPDVVVPGGAHALSLFQPGEVNDFLRRVMAWASKDAGRGHGHAGDD